MRFPASILVFASLALFAGEVRAHLDLLSPQPRSKSLKQGPCGAGPAEPRGPTVATFKPGEKIIITWNEYVDHPGHFRIALDEDGQDGFFDPKDFNDVSGGPGVIMDGIADKQGGDYAQEITLPDVECDNCVLQVVQVMTDKPPYGDGNDLYYQCADIAIMGVAGGTGGSDPGSTGDPETTRGPGSTGGATDATDGTAGPVTSSSASAGETAGTGGVATTGDEPTTGAAGSSMGATSSDVVTAGTGDATTDGGDKDSGCGCRSDDAGGLGWLAAGLLLPLMRRRRRS